LTGVLSGWQSTPMAERVILVVEFPLQSNQYKFYDLPMRNAADSSYSFAMPFAIPWNPGSVPANPLNDCGFFVATAPWAAGATIPGVSWRSHFLRFMNPL
jgi:hypothetical protein